MLVINTYVTADERGWLQRSATFYWALRHGDWQSTFLVGHPGVAVMWAGLPAYLLRFPEVATWPNIPWDSAQLEAALWQTTSPLEMLVTGRHVVILLISLTVAATYFPLRRLFDRPLAFIAILFMSWSPFFLALSTVLHPEGLLAAFSILSILLLLIWLHADRRARFLILSGIVLGLASLAKSPAVIVAVWGALAILLEIVRTRDFHLHGLAKMAVGFALWMGAAAAVYTLLWPVMWVDPVGTILRVFTQSRYYVVSGHDMPNFFLSNIVADPGMLFYPVAYLFRASPFALIGLVAAVWSGWRKFEPFDRSSVRQTIWGLVIFAMLFGLVMTVGAKKFDRYLLPAILALDIVAVAGGYSIIRKWVSRRSVSTEYSSGRRFSPATLIFIIALAVTLIHGALNIRHYPYYGTYFNPLLGGTRTAPRALLIGWGEGLDQAGKWVSEQTNSPVTIVSWYEDGPLSYFLPKDAKTLSFIESDHYWFDADYLVLYQNQVQRNNPDADMINHFLAQPADLEIQHAGLDLAWVYDLRDSQPPPFTGIHVDTAGPLNDNIYLAAYGVDAEAVAPGENAQITLFLKSHDTVDKYLLAEVALLDPSGVIVWQEQRPPGGISTTGWMPGEIREDRYSIPIAADAGAGTYSLMMRIVEEQAEGIAPSQQSRYVAPIHVQQPEIHIAETAWGSPSLLLSRLSHARSIAPGQSLLVDMEFDGHLDPAAKMSLRLTGADGMTWAQLDKQVAPQVRFELEIPLDAPPGTYTVNAVLYDGETLAPYPDQNSNMVSALSTVEIE